MKNNIWVFVLLVQLSVITDLCAQASNSAIHTCSFVIENRTTATAGQIASPMNVGACTLLDANGSYYLVTAYHVIQNSNLDGLKIIINVGKDSKKGLAIKLKDIADSFAVIPEHDLAFYLLKSQTIISEVILGNKIEKTNLTAIPVKPLIPPEQYEANDYTPNDYYKYEIAQYKSLRAYGVGDYLSVYRSNRQYYDKESKKGLDINYNTYFLNGSILPSAECSIVSFNSAADVLISPGKIDLNPISKVELLTVDTNRVRQGFSGGPLLSTPEALVTPTKCKLAGIVIAGNISNPLRTFNLAFAIPSNIVWNDVLDIESKKNTRSLLKFDYRYDTVVKQPAVLADFLEKCGVLPFSTLIVQGSDKYFTTLNKDPEVKLRSNMAEFAEYAETGSGLVKSIAKYVVKNEIVGAIETCTLNEYLQATARGGKKDREFQEALFRDLVLIKKGNANCGGNLYNVTFKNSVFERVQFEGVTIQGGDMSDVIFNNCKFDVNCVFEPDLFHNALFVNCEGMPSYLPKWKERIVIVTTK